MQGKKTQMQCSGTGEHTHQTQKLDHFCSGREHSLGSARQVKVLGWGQLVWGPSIV